MEKRTDTAPIETVFVATTRRPFVRTSYAPHGGARLVVTGLLYVLATLAAAGAFAAFAWTFWVFLSVAGRAFGGGDSADVLVPGALAAVGAWAVLYFASDRIAFGGNARLQRALFRKAIRTLPAPLPAARFFVEAYIDKGRLRAGSDVGWLFVYPDRLVFVGDRQLTEIPRDHIATEPVKLDANPFGLAAAWLLVPLAPPWGRLRLLARDNAVCASDTRRAAARLRCALDEWVGA